MRLLQPTHMVDCMRKPRKNLIGQTFNKWTVLELDKENTTKNTRWICQCECGKVRSVDSTHLTKGKSKMCRTCSHWKPKCKIYSRIWHRIKRNAMKRNLKFDLGNSKDGRDFLYKLLCKQKFKCALSGVPICLANTVEKDMHGETTASLDRIDSSLGYIRKNVQWTHKKINIMKWSLSQEEFVKLCKLIVDHNEME